MEIEKGVYHFRMVGTNPDGSTWVDYHETMIEDKKDLKETLERLERYYKAWKIKDMKITYRLDK